MQNTVNLNLKKPDQNDFVNIGDINDNMDILDAEVAKKYVKPLAGIPSLDLDSATQAALKKAETALQSVTKASVGLGNVDNTSDVNKPVSTAQQVALDKKANLASPILTGTPTAPTAAESTNTQQIATTAFVDRAVKTHQADLVSHGIYGVATGTNALVMTDSKVTSYVDGMLVAFKNTTASTSATTLNINNLGAIPIINSEREAQTDLKNNGVYTVRYSDGNFILQGSQGVSKTTQISNLTAVGGNPNGKTINLTWTNPSDAKFKGVRIVYKTDSYPTNENDGTVFYDSNDGTVPSSSVKAGFVDGTTYYIRAFAYTYKNATRLYTTTTIGAQTTTTVYNSIGKRTITSSTTFTVPPKITSIDIFLVGGGGAGSNASSGTSPGGGGGGGYTRTYKKIDVTPGQIFNVVVGSGGYVTPNANASGGNGGNSSFGPYSVYGGNGAQGSRTGGDGGSGGGSGYFASSGTGVGGSDGSDGGAEVLNGNYPGGVGQHFTTREFSEPSNTLYAGGGGGGIFYADGKPGLAGGAGGGGKGGGATDPTSGIANTGGGGGGCSSNWNAGNGGSGVVIVRWGY